MYGTFNKVMHRAAFLATAEFLDGKKNGTLVYLDDASMGASKYFSKRGVPPSALVPVNWDSAVSRRHRKAFPRAMHADINDAVLQMHANGERVAGVWLDLEVRTVRADVLKAAIGIAPVVFLTLSTRGKDAADVEREALAAVARAGAFCPELPARYCGVSGRLNMLKLVVTPNPRATQAPSTKVPVLGTRKRSADEMLGRTIYLPPTAWPDKRTVDKEYGQVKRKAAALCFRVTGTWYSRFEVTSVLQNNRLAPAPESWTLSPEDVAKFTQIA